MAWSGTMAGHSERWQAKMLQTALSSLAMNWCANCHDCHAAGRGMKIIAQEITHQKIIKD